MDAFEPNVTQPADSAPPSHHQVVARALTSAAVFGFIGNRIGYYVGRHISNRVAEPLLKWSMGGFWAALAAYASLKASAMERGEAVPKFMLVEHGASDKALSKPVLDDTKEKSPMSMIEVDTLKNHGPVQAEPELQRT